MLQCRRFIKKHQVMHAPVPAGLFSVRGMLFPTLPIQTTDYMVSV